MVKKKTNKKYFRVDWDEIEGDLYGALEVDMDEYGIGMEEDGEEFEIDADEAAEEAMCDEDGFTENFAFAPEQRTYSMEEITKKQYDKLKKFCKSG